MGNYNLYFVFVKQDGSAKVIREYGNGYTTVDTASIVFTYADPKGVNQTVTLTTQDIADALGEPTTYDQNDYMWILANGKVEYNNVKDVTIP